MLSPPSPCKGQWDSWKFCCQMLKACVVITCQCCFDSYGLDSLRWSVLHQRYWRNSKHYRSSAENNSLLHFCFQIDLQWFVYTAKFLFSHLLRTVTTLWLVSDCVVTVYNCRQSGDYTAIGSSVIALSAVVNSHFTVTTQSLSYHSVVTVPSRWLTE